jgi:hypothetical protein
MTATGPNHYVVVGDSDSWDLARRATGIAVGRTLRDASGALLTGGAAGCILGRLSRMPALGVAYYAEFEALAVGFWYAGLTSAAPVSYTASAVPARSLVSADGGVIFNGGASVQTSLPLIVNGDRIGVRLRNDAGAWKVQFYRNGSSYGTEITLATSHATEMLGGGGAWLFFGTSVVTTAAVLMHTDAADLLFLPPGSQPWGAAARVADAGGYSPALSAFTDATVGAGSTILSGGRVVSQSDDFDMAHTHGQRPAFGFEYVEFAPELLGGSGSLCGLCRPGANLSGTFVGGDAISWGYSSTTGQRWNGGVGVSAGYATWIAGDRPGYIRNLTSGAVWLTLNGMPQGGGSPEAGTLPAWAGLTGDLRPAVSPRAGGRMRVLTSGCEQLYRPSYCEARDSDLLPELHFRGSLGKDSYVERGIWYDVPWGRRGTRGGAVGAVEILNQSGRYNLLPVWGLRDQTCVVYRMWRDGLARLHSGLCDRFVGERGRTLRMQVRGNDAALDKRAPARVVAWGVVPFAPPRIAAGTAAAGPQYDVGPSALIEFSWLSGGVTLSPPPTDNTWARANMDKAFGARRSVQVTQRQCAGDLHCFREVGQVALVNGDLGAWAGDNPTGWAVQENGTTSLVTQVGGGARLLRQVGAPECSIEQTPASWTGPACFIGVRVSSYTSGFLTVRVNGLDTRLDVFEAGYYTVGAYAAAGAIRILQSEGGDCVVDSVTAIAVNSTATWQGCFDYVFRDLAGLPAGAFGTRMSGVTFRTLPMYWSDAQPIVREALESQLIGHSMDYVTDRLGVLQVVGFERPEDNAPGSARHAGHLVRGDLLSRIDSELDMAPALSDRYEYQQNFSVHQESELLSTTPTTRRERITVAARINRMTTSVSVPDFHPAYVAGANGPPVPRYTGDNVDASADYEAQRVRLAYSRLRHHGGVRVRPEVVRHMTPGQFVRITSSIEPGFEAGTDVALVSWRQRLVGEVASVISIWGY